jgi:hypothetical protein
LIVRRLLTRFLNNKKISKSVIARYEAIPDCPDPLCIV